MNPVASLLNLVSPQHRGRAAQTRVACTRAFATCELLPQFIACSHYGKFGLLNVLNGCFLRVADNLEPALVLTWQRSGGAESGTQEFFLGEEAQVRRFIAAMQQQALLLRDLSPSTDPEKQHAP